MEFFIIIGVLIGAQQVIERRFDEAASEFIEQLFALDHVLRQQQVLGRAA